MIHIHLANHYVLRDLSNAVDDGDIDEAKRLFTKYTGRFKMDPGLSPIACKVNACFGRMSSQTRVEVKARLEKLSIARRLESLNGSAHLFPSRLTLR